MKLDKKVLHNSSNLTNLKDKANDPYSPAGERKKGWGVWGVWEVWGDRDTKEN